MADLLFCTEEETTVPASELQPTAVPCNPALLKLAGARNVLLLQGPVGPFFDRLAAWLVRYGKTVHRVAFQPGDVADSKVVAPIPYTGTPMGWPTALTDMIRGLAIDAVVLFGQARRHHAAARDVCTGLGVPVIVMEEGYIRPGYATMELDGVNASSTTLDRYEFAPGSFSAGTTVATRRPDSTEGQFWRMAGHACRHYWHQYWGAPLSEHYDHHRRTSIWFHTAYWLRSWARKHVHRSGDLAAMRALAGRPYYFVPLQHEGDSQITHHSQYPYVNLFIEEVVASFASQAPSDALLVLKTHPHARGGPHYDRHARALGELHGIGGRVMHLVEGHTPTLVGNARGVVLINSTVGLQAIARCKPLAVLGEAVYKRPGLHHERSLDTFWTEAKAPDPSHVQAFLQQLIGLTQVPCNLYGAAGEPLGWTLHIQGREPGSPRT